MNECFGRRARDRAFAICLTMSKTVSMIPGLSVMPSDRGADLLSEFLWLTADLPEAEVAAIAGVSVPTICRWRRSGAQKVRETIRSRLTRYMESRQQPVAAPRRAA
jgi:hypothetical protein